LAEWLRWLRRSDVRAIALVGCAVLAAIAIQSGVLVGAIIAESVEEARRHLTEIARLAALRSAAGDAPDRIASELSQAAKRRRVAARIWHGARVESRSFGEWPAVRDQANDVGASALALARKLALGKPFWLVRSVDLGSDTKLELALSLRTDAREAGEFIAIAGELAALAAALAFAAAVAAVWVAFRPLHRATALLGVGPVSLSDRLPTRGTTDPVDRHAESVNRTLDALGDSFGRLRRFTRDVAHELRTPLNRIENVSEVALLSGDAERVRTALENAGSSAAKLGRVVQSLLMIAEIEDRRRALNPSDIDGDAWLQKLRELYAPLFEEGGKTLGLEGSAGRFRSDAVLLDRVLVNLVENALQHTQSGARVELRAKREASRLQISVEDSGPGIAREARKQLLDPAERGSSFNRSGGGLGLPLALAIADILGGELMLDDSPLGGARFVLVLPLAE